jgi:glycosyltransferase involved in cell wall biosynthesis
VRDLGVGPEIDLAGVLPIARVLKSVDALVLPWRAAVTTALYPSLVLEAAAAQCPIVATSLPELNDLWVPGHPGVRLVQPRDVDGLARALEELPRRREAQSQSSPLTLPDRQTVTRQLAAVYARALR